MNFTSLCLNINKQHGKFNMGDTQGWAYLQKSIRGKQSRWRLRTKILQHILASLRSSGLGPQAALRRQVCPVLTNTLSEVASDSDSWDSFLSFTLTITSIPISKLLFQRLLWGQQGQQHLPAWALCLVLTLEKWREIKGALQRWQHGFSSRDTDVVRWGALDLRLDKTAQRYPGNSSLKEQRLQAPSRQSGFLLHKPGPYPSRHTTQPEGRMTAQ